MEKIDLTEFTAKMNAWSADGLPYLFFIDFELNKPRIIPLENIDPSELLFDINGKTNYPGGQDLEITVSKEVISKFPVSLDCYESKFDLVKQHLQYGDSFLTNLTIDTEVVLSHTLKEVFALSKARYRLWYRDEFLVFSPETFVQMKEGKIFAYPMKGTIDADLEEAEHKILHDRKELAEHITIVDLIRNDLSRVASKVSVTRFRYLDRIATNHKSLYQVSSEIQGVLPPDYLGRMGDLLLPLLPAGSVSGAPKPRTLEIIKNAEQRDRGYYTGVVGLFDGKQLDCGVMIRFIENRDGRYFYKSGGGITTQSEVKKEYQEVIDKVYVPIG